MNVKYFFYIGTKKDFFLYRNAFKKTIAKKRICETLKAAENFKKKNENS